MRLARHAGRLTVLTAGGGVDVERATGGRFSTSTLDALDRWEEFRDIAGSLSTPTIEIDLDRLEAPIPMSRQVFAIGINYRDHAAEAGIPDDKLPKAPMVFTKFPTSVTGPNATVALSSNTVDYEAELVVVIGATARRVSEDAAWGHVAGLMVGQDLSDRTVQLAPPAPQFSLGKSFAGYSPCGPAIVTLDEIPEPDALDIGCRIGDEVLQAGNTKDLLFGVPELIARLSRVCPLLPGDTIWSGTPAGVGNGRTPKRFLRPAETLISSLGTVGEISTHFVKADDYASYPEGA